MPLDRFVLLIVIVLAAAGATIWLAALVAGALHWGGAGWLVVVPVTLVGYVLWRVIADRLHSSEDDHYDQIEK